MSNLTLFGNNSESTLAAGISAVDTAITVATGEGAKFPTVAAPEVAYLTLDDGTNVEIVQVTTHTVASDSFTVVRAQEGTTGLVFNLGDAIELRVTAGIMDGLIQLDNGGNAKGTKSTNISPYRFQADLVASGNYSIGIGSSIRAAGAYSLTIGNYSYCDNDRGVVVGPGAKVYSNYGMALGSYARVQAASNGGLAIGGGTSAATGPDVNGTKATAIGHDTSATGTGATVLGAESNTLAGGVAIGYGAAGGSTRVVCIGEASSANISSDYGIAIGYNNKLTSSSTRTVSIGADCLHTGVTNAVAIGNGSHADDNSVAIGSGSDTNTSINAVTLGVNSDIQANCNGGIAIGANATLVTGSYGSVVLGTTGGTIAGGQRVVTIGDTATSGSVRTVNIGANSSIAVSADRSIGIGSEVVVEIPDVAVIAGPIICNDPDSPSVLPNTAALRLRHLTGAQSIISSEGHDLANTQNIEISLPANFYCEEVGVIATGANTVTVQPIISVGTTNGGVDIRASALTTGLTAVGKRYRDQSPLLDDTAISSIFFNVDTGATAVSLTGRFYAKGFFIQS